MDRKPFRDFEKWATRRAVLTLVVLRPTAGDFVMQLSGLFSILKFFLLLFLALLIVLVSMSFGGVLVASFSLPVLFVLPTVRRPLVKLTASIRDESSVSITSRQFIGVYLLLVYAYGLSLVLFSAMLAETFGKYEWLFYQWHVDIIAVLVAVTSIGAGTILIVRRATSEVRLRAVAEWVVFLSLVDGLILIAAFVTPLLIVSIIETIIF